MAADAGRGPGRVGENVPELSVKDVEQVLLGRKRVLHSNGSDSIDHYRNLTACLTRTLKPRCTTEKVKRREHESRARAMQARPDRVPEAMELRRQTIEHPFATLKAWMSSTHFLTNCLDGRRPWRLR